MNELKELIKKSFEIWCMKRWQKYIDKELNLHHKYSDKATQYKDKANHHLKIAQKLYDDYSKKYAKESES